MKTKNLRPLAVQEELIKRGMFLFTFEEFRRVFDISYIKAKYFLETYTEKKLFTRIKKGLYGIENHLPDEKEIANIIYKPSYISLEYALAKYSIIPEMVYSITSVTTKPTREFYIKSKPFSFLKIKKQAFTGYLFVKEKKHGILIAEPEKAFVDYLYFVSLGKKELNERLNFSALNKRKVMDFAKLYNRPGLIKIIKEIMNKL